MSFSTNQESEDQFLCSICLDVLTDPVSIPCGHNFCKNCISQFWDHDTRYLCPFCKEMFHPKPELQVNTLISDLTEEFRRSRNNIQKQNLPDPEERPHDASTGAMWTSQMFWLLLACLFVVLAALMKHNYPLTVKLKKAKLYTELITFDPDTAHRCLIVSDDGKQVRSGKSRKLLYTPKRFSLHFAVLGYQSFSSGRFNFEVLVKGKTDWTLGVAEESIDREREGPPKPQNGYWTIRLRNRNKYKALAGPDVVLPLQTRPEKVGVFVDYEDGLVSFYDAESEALIYSFTGCSFTKKLYPYFSPSTDKGGENSAPLVIVSP